MDPNAPAFILDDAATSFAGSLAATPSISVPGAVGDRAGFKASSAPAGPGWEPTARPVRMRPFGSDTKGPIMPTPGASHVIDVDRRNLSAVQPLFITALAEAQFVAIDTEFSGLGSAVDSSQVSDFAERYKLLKQVAQEHALLQMGVSFFSPLPPDSPVSDNTAVIQSKAYSVTSFAFHLMPQSQFVVSPKSLRFLAEHGLDFNELFLHGIPINLPSAPATSSSPSSFSPHAPSSSSEAPEDSFFSTEDPLIGELLGAAGIPALSLSTQAASSSAAPQPAPLLSVPAGGMAYSSLPLSPSSASLADLATTFEDLMKKLLNPCSIPLVTHLGLLDLLYIHQTFIGPLPDKPAAFISALLDLMPGGLYDTRFIADTQEDERSSYLGYLFERYSRANAYDPEALATLSNLSNRPSVADEELEITGQTWGLSTSVTGTSNNGGSSSTGAWQPPNGRKPRSAAVGGAHSAGWDAFATGWIFGYFSAKHSPHTILASRNRLSLLGSTVPLPVSPSYAGSQARAAEDEASPPLMGQSPAGMPIMRSRPAGGFVGMDSPGLLSPGGAPPVGGDNPDPSNPYGPIRGPGGNINSAAHAAAIQAAHQAQMAAVAAVTGPVRGMSNPSMYSPHHQHVGSPGNKSYYGTRRPRAGSVGASTGRRSESPADTAPLSSSLGSPGQGTGGSRSGRRRNRRPRSRRSSVGSANGTPNRRSGSAPRTYNGSSTELGSPGERLKSTRKSTGSIPSAGTRVQRSAAAPEQSAAKAGAVAAASYSALLPTPSGGSTLSGASTMAARVASLAAAAAAAGPTPAEAAARKTPQNGAWVTPLQSRVASP